MYPPWKRGYFLKNSKYLCRAPFEFPMAWEYSQRMNGRDSTDMFFLTQFSITLKAAYMGETVSMISSPSCGARLSVSSLYWRVSSQ